MYAETLLIPPISGAKKEGRHKESYPERRGCGESEVDSLEYDYSRSTGQLSREVGGGCVVRGWFFYRAVRRCHRRAYADAVVVNVGCGLDPGSSGIWRRKEAVFYHDGPAGNLALRRKADSGATGRSLYHFAASLLEADCGWMT